MPCIFDKPSHREWTEQNLLELSLGTENPLNNINNLQYQYISQNVPIREIFLDTPKVISIASSIRVSTGLKAKLVISNKLNIFIFKVIRS